MTIKPKTQFLMQVWNRIDTTGSDALDAILWVCENNNVDIESAARIANRDPKLKALLTEQATATNQLKV